ncbi:hypothetical protein P4283_15560 [Bacillus thuringiensis]|nr:hypothetical protein [Bacillus thuringiensis]
MRAKLENLVGNLQLSQSILGSRALKFLDDGDIETYGYYNRQRVVCERMKKEIEKMLKDSQWSKWKEVAKEHGISHQMYYQRVKRGLEPLEAATRPVMEKEQILKKGRMVQKHKRVFTDEELRIAASNGNPMNLQESCMYKQGKKELLHIGR